MNANHDESFSTTRNSAEQSDKKMVRGSFAVSLFIHAIILLLIGSIVVVPGAIQKLMPVASVPTAPVDIPQPPKIDEAPPQDQSLDTGGTPISDVPQAATPSQDSTQPDALVMDSPAPMAPRMMTSSGPSSIASDVFKQGGQGGSGGGAGGSGIGKGIMAGKTLFGSNQKVVKALEGRFYDLKQTPGRSPTPGNAVSLGNSILKGFVESGFDDSIFGSKYYSPSVRLYASHIFVPVISAALGPEYFNVAKTVKPNAYIIHYVGYVAPPTTGVYRFMGKADDWLAVALNGKVVFEGSLGDGKFTSWKPEDSKDFGGDWIQWGAHDFKKIDIVIGERPGGISYYNLFIQEKGKVYPGNVLPIFRVDDEKVELPPGSSYPEFSLGPVFKVKDKKTSE